MQLIKKNPQFRIAINKSTKRKVDKMFASIQTYDRIISNLWFVGGIIILLMIPVATGIINKSFGDFIAMFVIGGALLVLIISFITYFWRIGLKIKVNQFDFQKSEIQYLAELIDNYDWEGGSDTKKEINKIILNKIKA